MNAAFRAGTVLFLVLAACSGRVEEPTTTDGGQAATTPGHPADGTSAAATEKLSLDGVSELEFSQALLGGARFDGGACTVAEPTVRLVRATRTVTWAACDTASGTRVPIAGTRILTESELALFEEHVQAASWWDAPTKNCSYDGRLFAMNVHGAAGVQLYVQDNINCYADGRRVAPAVTHLMGELWQTASGTALP